eukprot:s459_g27.t1
MTFVQETIDAYLASCKRSKSSSSVDDDADDESGDDEQSQKDFNEFKAWLDSADRDRIKAARELILKKLAELKKQQLDKLSLTVCSAKPAICAGDQDETQPMNESVPGEFSMAMPVSETQDLDVDSGEPPQESEGRSKVLTRRDQLALKEEKQKKRKQAEADKKAAKETEVEPEKKPKRGRTAGNKRAGKEEAKPEVEETEVVETEKPRRRLRQMKTSECLPEEPADQPEPEERPVPEEVPSAPKPKVAKAKGKAKSAPKAKAESKAKAKPAPKRKAAAKKVAAKKVEKPESDLESDHVQDSDEDVNIETPKKQLFQSEDEGSGADQAPDHHAAPRPAKTKQLQKALESCVPDAHRASKRQRVKPAVEPRASGASLEEEEPVVKRKQRRSKGKGKKKESEASKVPLSPFAKKEVKRRKKRDDEVMRGAASEDKQIQAVILQHMKNVEGMTDETVLKNHLMSSLKDKELNKTFRLNEYWKRPAIGVKVISLGDGSLKNAPEVAYFGKSCIGACPKMANLELTELEAQLADLEAAQDAAPCPFAKVSGRVLDMLQKGLLDKDTARKILGELPPEASRSEGGGGRQKRPLEEPLGPGGASEPDPDDDFEKSLDHLIQESKKQKAVQTLNADLVTLDSEYNKLTDCMAQGERDEYDQKCRVGQSSKRFAVNVGEGAMGSERVALSST